MNRTNPTGDQTMSLIYSRKSFDAFLSLEDIARRAPASFSETKADHLSDRYGVVTTATAIDVLADYGFRPVQAAQKGSRKEGGKDHAAHLLAFAQDNAERVDGTRGEVLLYNSNDGLSALKLFAGAYRFVCSNGIVAGEGFEAKLRHTKSTVSAFEDMLRNTVENIPAMLERIRKMQTESVTAHEAIDLAYNAATLRWELDDKKAKPTEDNPTRGAFATSRTIEAMLRSRRWGDDQMNKWGVFNRIQESLMRGGIPIKSYSDKSPVGVTRMARPVGSVGGTVDVNRRLWDLVAA